MGFREQVRQEISEQVARLAADKKHLVPGWIAHAVCLAHVSGLNRFSQDSQFWEQGCYHVVRAETGQYLRRHYSPEAVVEDDGGQKTLPGIVHVQTHYIVQRQDEELAVPTEELTDEEIVATISRLRATGMTLLAHADELWRFLARRRLAPVALVRTTS